MKTSRLFDLVLALALVLMIGWLLLIGRPILIPIVTAVISVYVMGSATSRLRELSLLRSLPNAVLQALVLGLFTVVVIALAVVVASTAQEIAAATPIYQANLDLLVEGMAKTFNLDSQLLWDEIRAVTIDRFDLRRIVVGALGGFTSIGTAIFLVIVYAGFLMSERATLPSKINVAFDDAESARKTLAVISQINEKISDYLAVKTLINVILGTISFAILWALGVDFALFWAIVIALLNYIPYVGSLLGVLFPVVLSLAQFGSLATTLLVAALLVAAQAFVGSILEPRVLGRQLNLSPFVVLVSLSVWSTLWGVPGAILAIPLTSILVIILSNFEQTRFLAVLMAAKVDQKVLNGWSE